MRECKIEGCHGKHVARGFCHPHYDKLYRDKNEMKKYAKKVFVDWEKIKNTPVEMPERFRVDGGEYIKFGVDRPQNL